MADIPENGRPRRVRFNSEFNIGHVLTVVAIVGTIGGAVVVVKDDLRSTMSELKTEQRLLDGRIEHVVSEVGRNHAEEQTFRSEVRSTLTQLSGAVADLRVGIAQAANKNGKPR